jgi:prepilin-type N-terminal cleavage/methylation domain-containing protein
MKNAPQRQAGFSLLELMVALGVTLIITGAMYGLIASSQGAFRREPALIDRQQQIRIAMSRISEDVLNAGLGLGTFAQAFTPGLNGGGGGGMLGVRVAGDPNLGGGNSDFLELRQPTADCPAVRVTAIAASGYTIAAAEQTAIWGPPANPCYQNAGWMAVFFPDGNAKFGWRHQPVGLNNLTTQPAGSQLIPWATNQNCSLFTGALGGACAVPPATTGVTPDRIAALDVVRYQLGNDTDGAPALFRSTTGGFDPAAETFANPPGNAWQVVARGIEDLQIRYRTFAGWQDNAPIIIANVAAPYDNIVREVEVTLWARTLGENQLQGQTKAVGNGVTAVRGSMVTSIAPRAAQTALMQETDVAKRWQ